MTAQYSNNLKSHTVKSLSNKKNSRKGSVLSISVIIVKVLLMQKKDKNKPPLKNRNLLKRNMNNMLGMSAHSTAILKGIILPVSMKKVLEYLR